MDDISTTCLLAAARQGCSSSQLKLGLSYLNGKDGHPKSTFDALLWFEKAATQSNEAAYYAGAIYLETTISTNNGGVGLPTTSSLVSPLQEIGASSSSSSPSSAITINETPSTISNKAIYYLTRASQTVPSAQYILGVCYMDGSNGLPVNRQESYNLFQRAAVHGNHPGAQFLLGVYLQEEERYTEAVQQYLNAANQNNPQACYNVSLCYEYGLGVPQNEQMAFEYIQKGANLNCPQSQLTLGDYFCIGKGCERNVGTALELWRLAFENGHLADAGYNIAITIFSGDDGICRDESVACKIWTNLALDHRHAKSYSRLGYCYLEGTGVPIDYTAAKDCFVKGVELGDLKALDPLAECFEFGYGVPIDMNVANDLYRKAAEYDELLQSQQQQ